MSWIANVSLSDIIRGHHYDPGPNSMLISIVDPDMELPTPRYPFGEVHRFRFLDIEEPDHPHAITTGDADRIAQLLRRALDKRMNVVVHCVAGVCRSGAVTEVGVMLGFDDTEGFRSPNLLVKQRLMQALGLDNTYTDTGG